ELTVDYDFLDLFGIGIAVGRNFSPDFPSDAEDAVLVNEAGAAALGYTDPLGREFITPVHGGVELRSRIVGVIKDFNMLSLHQGISPMRLTLDPDMGQRYLSIKISEADMPQTLSFIEDRFLAVSSTYPFEYEFFDDVFFQVYTNEEKMGQMFNAFGFLAVLIGCLGLFGLASFSIEQKTKVIGIRKVLGASIPGLTVWLSRDFITWVAAANILAWPVAYYLMKNWLNNFTYRISLGIGIFLLAAAAALGLALVTVLFQTVKAATADPVHALRHE
ncbi:MAG: ABC transporter permease, partial [Candidatus Aminicenantes bacterium]|nr:ABC transporter permease [Candidatus Aminicenantes bacterium]